jgi:hypothetical protein
MTPQTDNNTQTSPAETTQPEAGWRDDFAGSDRWLEALAAAFEHADQADESYPTDAITSYYSRY